MKLKVFVADDDAGMRLVLRRIIESMDGFELAGEAADGADAVRQCVALKPEVVFLDVEMPEMTGTEAARELAALLPEAAIVFVTAHSEYMPEAFEVYAFDYLVKPFRTDRVRQTLRRLSKSREKEASAGGAALMIKNKDGISVVQVADVILAYREDRLSYVVTKDEIYATSRGLGELWPYFEGKGFMRSHRAFIIKISEVAKIYPYGRWTWQVRFRSTDKDALITHDMLEQLQAALG